MPETLTQDEEMQAIRAETLATLYLETHPEDDLNRQAIRRFADWLVKHD